MATYYNKSSSAPVSITVVAADVYLDTKLAIRVMDKNDANPISQATVGAVVNIDVQLAESVSGNGIVGKNVTVSINKPDGTIATMTVVTSTNGLVTLANLTLALVGAYSFTAAFAGTSPTGSAPGYKPSVAMFGAFPGGNEGNIQPFFPEYPGGGSPIVPIGLNELYAEGDYPGVKHVNHPPNPYPNYPGAAQGVVEPYYPGKKISYKDYAETDRLYITPGGD